MQLIYRLGIRCRTHKKANSASPSGKNPEDPRQRYIKESFMEHRQCFLVSEVARDQSVGELVTFWLGMVDGVVKCSGTKGRFA